MHSLAGDIPDHRGGVHVLVEQVRRPCGEVCDNDGLQLWVRGDTVREGTAGEGDYAGDLRVREALS